MSAQRDVSVHPDFARARYLVGRCRLRRAYRACVRALGDEPTNAHALALKTRLDAHRKKISNDRAMEILQGLVAEHPGDVYLEVGVAVMVAQAGDMPAAIAQLRTIADVNGDDPYVHQVLAGLLGCDRSTWDEAFDHYQTALRSGPLMTPTYQGAALYLAKRFKPEQALAVLAGATPLEMAAIRTRALGFMKMSLLFTVLTLLSLALIALGRAAGGIAVIVLAVAWGGWAALTNYTVGCWKCALSWLVMTVGVPALAVWAISLHPRTVVWGAVVGIAAVEVFQGIGSLRTRSVVRQKSL